MKPNGKAKHSATTPNGHAPVSSSPAGNGSAADEGSPYAESLLDKCASTPRLQAFNAAIGAAGLTDLLRGSGPLTIFAPTDRAFDKLPGDERAALLGDAGRLSDLIRHHVVTGRVKAPKAQKPRNVTPQFGDALHLTASDAGFHVDEARIVKTNIRASNGVIHAIDTILDPG